MNDKKFWTQRYKEGVVGWNIGYPSTPLKAYIDQLKDKNSKILIPGSGNAYEAEYLWKKGFANVYVLDISEAPLQAFKQRNPNFPNSQLLNENFFEHNGKYDLILEQTFFCSFVPTDENRNRYAKQMHNLLVSKGKLVGLWFTFSLTGNMEKRPFGGNKDLYLSYLSPFFKTKTFEQCHNSIPERRDNELFGIFLPIDF